MERAVESDARLQPAIAAWHRCMDDRPPHLRPRAAMLSDLKTRLTALMGPHGNTPDRAALTALQQQERRRGPADLAAADVACEGGAVRRSHPAWLAHDRRGSGPPLVLIHGIGSHWQVWRPVLAEVARHRDVIALDLPGFGASPTRPGGGSVDALADRVTAFIDALGLVGPHVAGSSLGGGVALELGRRRLARSVTAFSPVGFWGRPGRRWCRVVVTGARFGSRALAPALPRLLATRAGRVALCGAFYARAGRLDPADCLSAATALAGAPGFAAARDALGGWRLATRPPPRGTAPTAGGRDPGGLVERPVTIAWGTRDVVLPYRSQARRARAALPQARHVTLPGCGHLPFADDPAACAELLTARQ